MSIRLYGRTTATGVQRSVFIAADAMGVIRADHWDRYPDGASFPAAPAELFDTEAEAVESMLASGYALAGAR